MRYACKLAIIRIRYTRTQSLASHILHPGPSHGGRISLDRHDPKAFLRGKCLILGGMMRGYRTSSLTKPVPMRQATTTTASANRSAYALVFHLGREPQRDRALGST